MTTSGGTRGGVALLAVILSAVFTILPSGRATAVDTAITGVWACQHTRPGSTLRRPLTFVFHHDGTVA